MSQTNSPEVNKRILVMGATGYVGSRLVVELLDHGYIVRVIYRSREKLEEKLWHDHPNIEAIQGDVFDVPSLNRAMEGCEVIYYLIHNMDLKVKDFSETEAVAAENTVNVAHLHSIKRIIFMGGLYKKTKFLSRYLSSHDQVAKILSSGSIPLTNLKVGIIIGSGSTSFEIFRYLVERVPIMVTPKWMNNKTQPIAIRNIIDYMVKCLDVEETVGKTFDVAGPHTLTLKQFIQVYASEAGLKPRVIFTLPFDDFAVSAARMVGKVVPMRSDIVTPLMENLKVEAVSTSDEIRDLIPLELIGIREAIRRAIAESRRALLHESFQSKGLIPPIEWSYFGDSSWSGGYVFYDRRAMVVKGDRKSIWKTISSIGGYSGWYYKNHLWVLRGFMDWLVGGPGLRKSTWDDRPKDLSRGDIVDWWRVASVHKEKELLLNAELRMPGYGTLRFTMDKIDEQHTLVEQTAVFVPRGLWGLVYWKIVEPMHMDIFKGMIKALARVSNTEIVYGPKFLARNKRL